MKKDTVLLMFLFIKMKYFILLSFLSIFFFVSCYEQAIVINKDNSSGKINLKLKINDDFKFIIMSFNEIAKTKYDKFSVLFNKDTVNSISNENFKLSNYNLSKVDNSFEEYSTEFLFKNFSDISEKLPCVFFPTQINVYSDYVLVSTDLSLKKQIDKFYNVFNEKETNIINIYSDSIKLKFIYNLPDRVLNIKSKNVNLDYLSKDAKEISFSIKLSDILKAKDDLEINFTYQKR